MICLILILIYKNHRNISQHFLGSCSISYDSVYIFYYYMFISRNPCFFSLMRDPQKPWVSERKQSHFGRFRGTPILGNLHVNLFTKWTTSKKKWPTGLLRWPAVTWAYPPLALAVCRRWRWGRWGRWATENWPTWMMLGYQLVGGLVAIYYFPIQLGISSSQLTFIFFRGFQTTNQSSWLQFWEGSLATS